MKSLALKKLFVILITSLLLIPLSGCMFKKEGWAPRSIKDKSVAYHNVAIGGPADKDILNKTLIYKYDDSGHYKSYFQEGGFFEAGDYSYLKIGDKKAKMTLSYSMENTSYVYEFEMDYESPTTGKWAAEMSNNPRDTGREYGTFWYVDH